MKAIVKDRSNRYKAIGIPAGSFVTIFQGASCDPILEANPENFINQCFRVAKEMPHCGYGTGIYFVKSDFTLINLESNYDSSD